MTNNQNIYAKILFIGALFNIVLNYILIPIYGVNGAASCFNVKLSYMERIDDLSS